MNGFAQILLKCRHKGPVLGCRPLEQYGLSDVFLHSHLAEIVFPDGVQHRSQHLIFVVPSGEVMIDVSFHKNRTTVACDGGPLPFTSPGVRIQRAAQPKSLLLYETAGPGSADGIHDGKGDVAVLQGGKFAVLTTDLQNGVHIRVDLHGSPCMGGDFIDHQIGIYDPAGEFSTRSGGAGTDNGQVDTFLFHQVINGGKHLLHGDDRSAGRPGVKSRQHLTAAV